MPSPFPQMFGGPAPDFEVSELPEGLHVTRTSLFTRKRNSMTLKTTPQQFMDWQRGKLIQDAFPELTADEREFLQSGATPEEWDNVFGKEEEG